MSNLILGVVPVAMVASLAKLNKKTHCREYPMAKPACFDTQANFDAWMEASRTFAVTANVNPKNYCIDCTPKFQELMKREGRCGYPDVIFIESEGGVYGRRPQVSRTKS